MGISLFCMGHGVMYCIVSLDPVSELSEDKDSRESGKGSGRSTPSFKECNPVSGFSGFNKTRR